MLWPSAQKIAAAAAAAAPTLPSHSLTALSPLNKLSLLLVDAPLCLQPDIISLMPRFIGVQEHPAATALLVDRLAEASQQGPEVENALRLPVLSALAALKNDPAVVQKVVQAAVEVRREAKQTSFFFVF